MIPKIQEIFSNTNDYFYKMHEDSINRGLIEKIITEEKWKIEFCYEFYFMIITMVNYNKITSIFLKFFKNL